MNQAAACRVDYIPCDPFSGGQDADPEGTPAVWRRLRPDLRQAAREGAFALAYQSRRRMSDETVCGAEAQLRWPSRHHGVVQASVFMPLAEECGCSRDIVAWTLAVACRTALAWPDGVISVTVPARTARDGQLLPLVAAALADSSLPPERLEISLPDRATEGDCTETLLALSALRDKGWGWRLRISAGRRRA